MPLRGAGLPVGRVNVLVNRRQIERSAKPRCRPLIDTRFRSCRTIVERRSVHKIDILVCRFVVCVAGPVTMVWLRPATWMYVTKFAPRSFTIVGMPRIK